LAKTAVDNRIARHQRDKQLQDLEVINDKRKQQREQLEQERLIEKEYQKEMYMYQRGLTDVVPVSLNKRLSALQANEDKENNTEKNMLEFRAVVKGKRANMKPHI
jgi:translation initiation factor IF-2